MSRLNDILDGNAKTVIGRLIANIYLFTTIIFIFLTPIILSLRMEQVGDDQLQLLLTRLDNIIFYFFTVDLLLRLVSTNRPFKYLFSQNGLIDALSVIPEWIGILLGLGINTKWLRILRLFRISKILIAHQGSKIFNGFTGVILAITVGIMSLKVLIMIFERESWFPVFDDINMILGLVSFSLAMLLGTKLSIVSNRFDLLEETIARVAIALQLLLVNTDKHTEKIKNWIYDFQNTITNPTNEKVLQMQHKTGELYKTICPPGEAIDDNLFEFSRDVQFILATATSEVPPAYEKFLKEVTFVFTLVALFAIPGLTGLVASMVLSYIFYGMVYVIEDMDHPLDTGDGSLISVNLNPIDDLVENIRLKKI
jgi:hypothetical protein